MHIPVEHPIRESKAARWSPVSQQKRIHADVGLNGVPHSVLPTQFTSVQEPPSPLPCDRWLIHNGCASSGTSPLALHHSTGHISIRQHQRTSRIPRIVSITSIRRCRGVPIPCAHSPIAADILTAVSIWISRLVSLMPRITRAYSNASRLGFVWLRLASVVCSWDHVRHDGVSRFARRPPLPERAFHLAPNLGESADALVRSEEH